MNDPSVLAVIPAYNSSKYIENTVKSLLAQNYPNLSIYVIDDNSTDNTYEIAKKYAPAITIIRNNINRGFLYNLQKAISMAQDYNFLFILEDDVELINSDYISIGINNINHRQTAVICGQNSVFNNKDLSLIKRCFVRYWGEDYEMCGINEISYSLFKADLIKMTAMQELHGISYSLKKNIYCEDQILAKQLHDRNYIILKNSEMSYKLNYARCETLYQFLKSEFKRGITLGSATSVKAIEIAPKRGKDTTIKYYYRLSQVIFTLLLLITLGLLIFYTKLGSLFIVLLLVTRSIIFLLKSQKFSLREKIYLVAIGLLNDIVFAAGFYLSYTSGIISRFICHPKNHLVNE